VSGEFPKISFDHATARVVPRAQLTPERVGDLYNGAQLAMGRIEPLTVDHMILSIIVGTCHYLLGLPNVNGTPYFDHSMATYDKLREDGERMRMQAEGECKAAEDN